MPHSSKGRARPSAHPPVLSWSLALLIAFGWVLAEPIPRLLAAITSAALRAAGFNAADGANNGKKIVNANELKAVNDAIDKLATAPGTADCVKCLREMLKNDRLCKETGTSGAGATTLPDKKAGCDPKADAINLNPNFASWPVETLACALAHEWCHTNQTDFSGNFEKPCYQVEVDCLKALGQDKVGQPSKRRYDQMLCCLKELEKKDQELPNGRAPTAGGRVTMHQDSNYSVFSSQAPDEFWGIPPGYQLVYGYKLKMTIVYDFVLLDNVLGGSTVAMVVGRDVPRDMGIVQAIVVKDGVPKSEVFTLELPGVEPFALVHDPARAVVYLLDTAGDQVLRLIDTNSDGVPDAPASNPFATATSFPALANALGIGLNVGAQVPSIFIDPDDTRSIDALRVEAPRTILFDDNADGRADRSLDIVWRDLIALMPGYLSKPVGGQTKVDVFAGTGAHVQVQLTDASGNSNLGVLGNGTVPVGSNEVIVSLNTTLQVGSFIRTLDLDNPQLGSFPLMIEAMDDGEVVFFGSSCPHSKGTPQIGFAGEPVIGNDGAAVTGAGLIANNTVALVIGQPAAQPVPLEPLGGIPGSKLLLVVQAAVLVGTDAGGRFAWPVRIPFERGLVGVQASFQILDPDWTLSYALPLGHSCGMGVQVGGGGGG